MEASKSILMSQFSCLTDREIREQIVPPSYAFRSYKIVVNRRKFFKPQVHLVGTGRRVVRADPATKRFDVKTDAVMKLRSEHSLSLAKMSSCSNLEHHGERYGVLSELANQMYSAFVLGEFMDANEEVAAAADSLRDRFWSLRRDLIQFDNAAQDRQLLAGTEIRKRMAEVLDASDNIYGELSTVVRGVLR